MYLGLGGGKVWGAAPGKTLLSVWKGGGSRKGAFLVRTPPSAMPELARVRGLPTSLSLPTPGTDEGCGLNVRGQVWQLDQEP